MGFCNKILDVIVVYIDSYLKNIKVVYIDVI